MLSVPSIVSLVGMLIGISQFSIVKMFNFFEFPSYLSIGVPLLLITSSYIFISYFQNNKGSFEKLNFFSAFLLGSIASMAIFLMHSIPYHSIFAIYVIQLCFFHWSEFFLSSLSNPNGLKIDLYMLNHSTEYKIALLLSVIEYWLEKTYFPVVFQHLTWLSYLGLLISVLGEVLRKISLWTAGQNFNHYVEFRKRDDHVLVRRGVYNWFRHPSYVGWFYFSVGTQIALLNPICLIGYAVASWLFFYNRIYEEEQCLLRFFGEDYVIYQQDVGTGLPFIRGYHY